MDVFPPAAPLARPHRIDLRAILTAAVLLLISGTTRADVIPFTDVTTPSLADTLNVRDKKGVAWVDFDGDGDLDLCVVGEGSQAIALYRNDGGNFVDITRGDLIGYGSGSSETWGDYDNDGDPDLFVGFEEGPHKLFRNDGNGVFTNVASGLMTVPTHAHSSAWLDADADGKLDLYIANLKQPGMLLHNMGGGTFLDMTNDSLGCISGDGVAVGDWDDDGLPDIYLARWGFRPKILEVNEGGGRFVRMMSAPLANAGNGHAAAWADIDNDGDLDLFYCNVNTPNVLARNDGIHAGFKDATPSVLALGGYSAGVCFGDFDNDGDQDVLVTMNEGLSNHLFINVGAGQFMDLTPAALSGTGTDDGSACGDFDGDGDLDIYTSANQGRPNHLLRNDLNNHNHWLEIDLEGTVSNKSAIGARVTVVAGNLRQIRELTGCTGFRSQSALQAHFGLGTHTSVDRITVRWPTGFSQDTTIEGVDKKIHIVENPPPLGVGWPRAQRGDLAIAVQPNPARAAMRIRYALPVSASVRVEVIDLAGRAVRTIEDGTTREPGAHELLWDGSDASGRPAREGVYFVRVAAGATRAVARVVKL